MHMCFGLVALVVCYFSSHRSLRETVIRVYHAIMCINRYPQLGQKERLRTIVVADTTSDIHAQSLQKASFFTGSTTLHHKLKKS